MGPERRGAEILTTEKRSSRRGRMKVTKWSLQHENLMATPQREILLKAPIFILLRALGVLCGE
jgi:hypothetical protein